MFAGTALGQLTSLLLSPLLTRIYSPDLFGILGFFTAISAILAVISTLRYDMALPLAKSNEEAINLFAVCVISLLFTISAFCLFLVLLPSEVTDYLFGELKPYRFLLPIGFAVIGSYQMMVNYATYEGAFAVISRTKIYQGVTGPVSQIILGLSGLGVLGLIIGFILGQAAGIFNIFRRLILQPKNVLNKVNKEETKRMARRFYRFPLVSTWSALISAVGSNNLLLVVVPLLYSNTIAGFIFLTDRIIGRPLLLISSSILQVYMGEAAKTQTSDPEAMRKRFLQIIKAQFFIVSFWLIVINATAFYFVPIVFGNDWAGAVIYINILSIYYLPQMVMTAVAHTLYMLEKQGLMAIWEISRFAIVAGVFALSYYLFLTSVQAILLYSLAQAVMTVTLLFLMYFSIQKPRSGKD